MTKKATAEHSGRFAYEVGEKVRNRHIDQYGVITGRCENRGGDWYYMATQSGMSIGWWHETDIDGAPRTPPPAEKTQG